MANKVKLSGYNDDYGGQLHNETTQEYENHGRSSSVYNNQMWNDMANAENRLAQYQVPSYEGKYDSRVEELYNTLNNFGQNYNYNTDPAYQAYRKEYLRNGQRATQDTMAAAATMTGGRPSSYAATAAAQAGNNYAAQLSDKIPELYNQAYNRYMQQFQNAMQMQQNDYNRFAQERNANYQWLLDNVNTTAKLWELDANMREKDRDYYYKVKQDRIKNMQNQQSQDWNQFMQQAQIALQAGDYETLRKMGFNVSKDSTPNDLAIAQIIAQVTGDTSLLRSMFGKG